MKVLVKGLLLSLTLGVAGAALAADPAVKADIKAGADLANPSDADAKAGKKNQLDLNTATEAELDALPSITTAQAKAIVAYRTKNGMFKSVDDLKNVPGLGNTSSIKTRVMVGTAETEASGSATTPPASGAASGSTTTPAPAPATPPAATPPSTTPTAPPKN